MVVSIPGLRTISAGALGCRWWTPPSLIARRAADAAALRLQTIELGAIDRIELDGVAGFHQERLGARGIEGLGRRAADQLPSARRLRRINAGLDTGDADRSDRHAHARRRVPRHGDPFVDESE